MQFDRMSARSGAQRLRGTTSTEQGTGSQKRYLGPGISIISVNVDLDGSRMVAYNVLPDGEPLQPQREATVYIPPNVASVKISVRSNLIGDTATTTVVEYLGGQSIVGDYRDEIRARFHYNTETSLHEIDFNGSGYQPQEMD